MRQRLGWMFFGWSLSLLAASCGGASTEPASARSAQGSEDSAAAPPSTEARPSEESASAEATRDSEPKEAPRGGESKRRPHRSPSPDAPVEERMRAHFAEAELIRAAVISGRPEDAAKPAYALAHLDPIEQVPASWVEPLKRLQDFARQLGDSSDVAAAAAATADIGTSCGWCHQKLGGPSPDVGEPPPSDGTVARRMEQHAWATERLWEALYIPSGAAWKAGTKVLTTEPFPEEVLEEGGTYARSAAADFSKIVGRAPSKTTVAQRAELYAELLGTCAVCHLALER